MGSNMSEPATTQTTESQLYTARQAAQKLGCSQRSLYRWEEARLIEKPQLIKVGDLAVRVYTEAKLKAIERFMQSRPSSETKLGKASSETFHEPPSYYNRGGYHCFDVMDALGLFTKYYIASAFTYIWRCDFKGDEAEALRDLKKARRYLDWEIKRREQFSTRTTHPDPQTSSIQSQRTGADAFPDHSR